MKICKKLLIPLFCCLLIGSVIPVCADEGVESAVSEGNIVDIDGEDNDLDEDVEMPLIGNEDDEESKDENRESIGEENIITDEIAGQNEEDTTGDIVESSEIDGAREPAQYTLRSQSDAMQWVKSKEGNKIGTGECVDLIKAYYEYLGVSPVYGNGSDYVGNTLPNGWQRIYKAIPQPGDILVYTGGANNWGHVAIFESTKITYHQNYIGKRFVQRITTVAYNGFDNPYWGVIRPDFNNKWYAALEPVNIGNECYGALIKNSGWATLGVKDSNVEVVKVIGATSEVWHFVRQSDGSYVVYNCEDNRVLEATGGINARVAQYVGGDNQKWYIYGRWSGEWIFRPKSSDYVLDIVNNSNTVGANAQLYGNNNSAAQKFAIYTFEKAGPSSISVSVGNSAAMTKFSWTAGKNVNYYNLRIKKGVPGNVSTYKDVWKIKATSYAIVLPAGYYEVYVDSCNSFSYSASNLIKFNVVQYVPKPVNSLKAQSAGKNKVKLTWLNDSYVDGYLIYAQKNGKYGYCGMTTKGITYTDTKALDSDYNFYWVFPYVQDSTGKMHPGGCTKYVFAKGTCLAVSNLKATSQTGAVRLTWSASAGAEGYLVYGKTASGKYGYIGMTTKGTSYVDSRASKKEYNYYWVYPYHKDKNGKMIVGGTPKYVYGKAR